MYTSASPARPLLARLGALLLGVFLAAALTESASAQAPPDAIELRDGSFLRGTIVERIEGDHVTIQLVTGELRTIPMSDVTFAGPEASRAAPQQATIVPVPRPDDNVTVRVASARSDARLTLHQLTGTATGAVWTGRGVAALRVDSYAPICVAPCEERIARGTYTFGVSENEGDAARALGPLTVDRDLAVELDYDNRGAFRVAGWITFGLTTAAALAMMLGPFLSSDLSSDDWVPWVIAGGAFYAVGIAVSLPMMLLNDAPRVRVLQ